MLSPLMLLASSRGGVVDGLVERMRCLLIANLTSLSSSPSAALPTSQLSTLEVFEDLHRSFFHGDALAYELHQCVKAYHVELEEAKANVLHHKKEAVRLSPDLKERNASFLQ